MKQRLEQLTKEIEKALQPLRDEKRREAILTAERYKEASEHDRIVQQQYEDYLDTTSQLSNLAYTVQKIPGFFARRAAERKIKDTLKEAQREYPLGYEKVLKEIASEKIAAKDREWAYARRQKEEEYREHLEREEKKAIYKRERNERDINSGS